MTIEEAIRMALEYERRVLHVYREAQLKLEDQAALRIMRTMESEEQYHIDVLHEQLELWVKSGRIEASAVEQRLPNPQQIHAGIAKLHRQMGEEDFGESMDVLRKAIEVERETSQFYQEMVVALPEEGKALFARFVEIEEGHLAIVQAEYDYLGGSGHWFDFEEFDLEVE